MTKRTLFLIRHAQPLSGDGPKRCSLPEDAPLDEAGLHQAALLGQWAREQELTAVWSSPFLRAIQTAQGLAADRLPIQIADDLREMDSGHWEGLTFDEIKLRWPKEYEARGAALGTTPPPGGESFADAGVRLGRAIDRILSQTTGNIAVVAHGGANRGWLCTLLGWGPHRVMEVRQPWGGITAITVEADGTLFPSSIGQQPFLYPDTFLQEQLLTRCGTPSRVIAHCRAVARCALQLAQQIHEPVDTGLLEAACLLHDILRDKPQHAAAGAKLLNKEGYPRLAEIISCHHDLPEETDTESRLLYLADKLIQEDQTVSLEERFQQARKKCGTDQALAAWQRRYDAAMDIIKRFQLQLS